MSKQAIRGTLLDKQVHYTLAEVCQVCASESEWVIAMVEEGVLQPSGKNREQWRFPGSSLHVAMRAHRLQNDFGLNPCGVALVLELLEEIETLRSRLRVTGT